MSLTCLDLFDFPSTSFEFLNMGPVFVVDGGTVQENQLSDEEYVIYRTKNSQKQDAATARAWMITAKTLFPRNFAVQVKGFPKYNCENRQKMFKKFNNIQKF